MNRQPYCKPPRWWSPKLRTSWVRWTRGYRRRQLRQKQRIRSVELEYPERLRSELAAGHGLLLTPNHSAHYDAPALYTAADSIDVPLHIMTAWQVFAMSSRWEQWAMQRLGCFSVDREGADRKAFKQAVQILREQPHPLVIFPEGDIYHTTDYVSEFRDGAAAVALAAAKRASRPVVVVPCGIKFWYIDDPTRELHAALRVLESHLHLRRQASQTLPQRIHRMAEAALALQELDCLGHTCSGRLRDRVGQLARLVLADVERRHSLPARDLSIPERVKVLRSRVIQRLAECTRGQVEEAAWLRRDMDDLFLVMQLYSYPGDYLVGDPSIERLAETVDKFEEDILGLDFPRVRGNRRVVIRIGEPIRLERGRSLPTPRELTCQLQDAVQTLVDEVNARSPK